MTRKKNINTRLTNKEHQELMKLVGARSISAYVRRRLLGSDRRQVQSERLRIVTELARVRNLLNQIARSSERRTPLDQTQIVAQLLAVERQLSKFKTA